MVLRVPRRARPLRDPGMPPLGEVLEFMRLLWDTHHALEAASKRMKRQVGMTTSQRIVLRLVDRFPGITPTRLAAVLRVHPSTVTGIVQRLERRRLVVREVDAVDRRQLYLALTSDGRRAAAEGDEGVEGAVSRILAAADPDAVGHVRSVLTALARELA